MALIPCQTKMHNMLVRNEMYIDNKSFKQKGTHVTLYTHSSNNLITN